MQHPHKRASALFLTDEIVGLGALVAVIGTGLCRRFWPHRVRHTTLQPGSAPSGVPASPAADPVSEEDESGSVDAPEVAPQPVRAPTAEPYRPMIFAAPRQQMIDFLRVVLSEHDAIKLPAFEWASFYREWATAHRMALMPDREFLTLLGKVENAKKSRDRVKDRMGRVIRNDHGTPLRVTYYALARLETVQAAHTTPKRRPTAASERLRPAA